MKVAIIDETALPAKGGVKASESQVNTGGFDMAMAAVMALLIPNSGDSPPAQNQIAGESVFSEEIARPSAENRSSQKTGDLVLQQDLLAGALALNALDTTGTQAQTVTVEEAQLPQQMVQTRKNEFPPVSSQFMAESIPVIKQADAESSQAAEGMVKVLENTDVQQTVSKTDNIIKDAKTVDATKGTFPLFAEAIREPRSMPEKTEIVLPSALQNSNVAAEGDSIRVPSGLGSNAEKLTPGKTVSAAFTPEANAQAAAAKVNIAAETGQGRSTSEADKAEVKGNFMFSGKIEAGGTSSTGEAKNESGGFNNSQGDAFLPGTAQINTAGALSGSTKNLKGVSLTDLKDVLVQEIKQIYDTRKGEPTQIQIKLEPENLGKLTIKLSYINGELNAHFYAGSDHVKGILEGSIQQLRESLGRQELILNQAFVFVGNENSGGAGSQMEFGNRQTESSPDRYHGNLFSQLKMEPDDYYQPDTDFSGVNYLI